MVERIVTVYAANPGFPQLQMVQANANALNATDKVIFTPDGTTCCPAPALCPRWDDAGGRVEDDIDRVTGSVTLSPCHPLTLSPCHLVILPSLPLRQR
ncbi:MAG: hypothetical protein R2911_05150 [Caldilineaceae bacterium]